MASKKNHKHVMSKVYNRPHHRTTCITVDSDTFKRFANLKPGIKMDVEFVNDIVSSAKGGNSIVHHSIRRVDLLRRQVAADYRKVNLRTEMGTEIKCLIVGPIAGKSDSCTGYVTIGKQY